MIYMIICLVVISVLTVVAFINQWEMTGGILATFAVCFAIAVSISGFMWKGAEVKATLLNKEYKTEYTTSQIFYASNVINTIREVQRTRIELNGNLINK